MAKNLTAEQLKKLKEQAKIDLAKEAEMQKRIAESAGDYLKLIKEIKQLNKDIAALTSQIAQQEKKIAEAAKDTSVEGQKKLAQEQAALLVLEEQLEEIERTTAAYVKQAKVTSKLSSIVKTVKDDVSSIRNIVEVSYGKIKNWAGLFDMDKAIRMSALQMGVLSKQSDSFRDSISAAANETTSFGVGIDELAKLQATYSEELGRTVMLGKEGLIAMGEMAAATGLGAEGTAKMAADMENQGYSAERTRDFVQQTMNDTHKMGLNASKVIKNIQNNMKMLNKYNFKGGVKGLAKMAETTTKLGVDMNFVSGMADKLFDIEGAVDMSAQLQVMGGEWSKLADPFKLMYMARNDMEGLTEAMGKAAEASVHFNEKTGEMEISALEMHKLRKIAEATGVAYEDIATAGKNAFKFSKIKGQVSFDMDEEDKEFLINTAKLDKNGKAYIEVDGAPRFLNQLGAAGKNLIKSQIAETATLKERADASQTFDERLGNLTKQFKQLLLPLLKVMDDSLRPVIDTLVKTLKDPEVLKGFKQITDVAASVIGVIGKFIANNPVTALVGGLVGFGMFEAAKWYLNGISLGKGFNMTASVGGGTGQLGGKGFGMRDAAAMDRAGMGTMGKIGANFKGGLGSTVTKLGGIVAGLTAGIDEWSENSEKGMGTGENVGRTAAKGAGAGLGAWGGAAAGAAIGSVVPVIGTLIGGIIGGALGAWGGGALGEGAGDLAFGDEVNDAIVSGGKITPIDNKDDLMAYKPNGPIDSAMKATQASSMKIDFGEIHFKFDELKVTSPGSPGLAIDLLKDPKFVRDITRMVHVETSKAIQGGKIKP